MTFETKSSFHSRRSLRECLRGFPHGHAVEVLDILQDLENALGRIQCLEAELSNKSTGPQAPADPDSNPEWLKKELGE